MSIEKIQQGDKLTQSKDLIADNIDKLKQLFPEIVTEGKIDFKVLQDVLGENIEEEDEYYRFTWAGKAQARREAHKPSTGTLRPVKADSVNWDTTENLYIEGDNLEVLKLLQKSYAGKVKMIYIDPPYNTGNDFVYKDNYKDNLKNYQEVTGQIDSVGNKLSTNNDTDGRYHSNWLNMMYPRLRLSRNLLSEDGIMFISIGQAELTSLVKATDDVFGESNRISIVGRLAKSGGNKGKFFSPNIEYLLAYAKKIEVADGFRDEMDKDLIKKVYTKTQRGGERNGEKYRAMGLYQSSLDARANQRYFVEAPDGTLLIPPGSELPKIKKEGEKIIPKNSDDGCWRWTYPKYLDEFKRGNVEFVKTNNKVLIASNGDFSEWNVNTKIWLKDRQEEGQLPNDFISKYENRHSAKELKSLEIPFDFPKPSDLIKYLVRISGAKNDDIILDFFSGSASTAHAVMNLNLEDKGKRKHIQVQLPQLTEEKSEAYKKGYKKITEIGKERIRRVAKKIIDENPEKAKDLDLGFKVFKLDSSNIKGWDGNPEKLQEELFDTVSNIKTDRTEEDVLYEILLKYGLDLTLPIEEKIIEGNTVFNVGFGALFICLGDNLTNTVAEGIGKWKEELEPEICRVIFKDTGFTDVEKTNSIQTLKRFGIGEIKSI
ncbi:site-specific DNA-methyltransferase [uncultured Tenacibaculum sp.]|uniref:site-specific DNA-methyltransferase n=1 Tax=uncultured Tenacibaculum sp. TaxID=174713 RepID=UPI002633135B|nr:site-specific DNA-methyltransferase [uncultured Tenacibaculum sp.]